MIMQKILIIDAYSGKIRRKNVVEGKLEEIVKKEGTDMLKKEWIPFFSDYMIIRDSIDIELKLPLKKEVYEFLKEYNLRKARSDTAIASIPLFFIVYESLKISEEKYHDRGVLVVAPYIREQDEKMLEELLVETTRKPSLGELEETVELEELEEEPPSSNSKRKSRGRGHHRKR